jgi:hypothetical protein
MSMIQAIIEYEFVDGKVQFQFTGYEENLRVTSSDASDSTKIRFHFALGETGQLRVQPKPSTAIPLHVTARTTSSRDPGDWLYKDASTVVVSPKFTFDTSFELTFKMASDDAQTAAKHIPKSTIIVKKGGRPLPPSPKAQDPSSLC